jgi:pantetheine-phosphate adenylyltransferase
MEKIALFPGSFDPITNAHMDILNRALPLFDKVYVGIGLNSTKEAFFSAEQRLAMLKEVFCNSPKIEVTTYKGLTVEFCKELGAQYMIRGIRSTSDFEYEKAISQMNHAMHPEIESIFILSKPGFSAISSTIVRDIIRNGGDVSKFVPKEIASLVNRNS